MGLRALLKSPTVASWQFVPRYVVDLKFELTTFQSTIQDLNNCAHIANYQYETLLHTLKK